MLCRKCEKDFDDSLNYCPNCGEPARKSRKIAAQKSLAENANDDLASSRPSVRKVKLNIPADYFDNSAMDSNKETTKSVPESPRVRVEHKTPERKAQKPVVQPPTEVVRPVRKSEIHLPNEDTEEAVQAVKPVPQKPVQAHEIQRTADQEVTEQKQNVEETESGWEKFKLSFMAFTATASVFFSALGMKLGEVLKALGVKLKRAGIATATFAKKSSKKFAAWSKEKSKQFKENQAKRKVEKERAAEAKRLAEEEQAKIRAIEEKERQQEELRRLHREAERSKNEFATEDRADAFARPSDSPAQKDQFIPVQDFLNKSERDDETARWHGMPEELQAYEREQFERSQQAGRHESPAWVGESRFEELKPAAPSQAFEARTPASTFTKLDNDEESDFEDWDEEEYHRTGFFQKLIDWFIIRVRGRHIAAILLLLIIGTVIYFLTKSGSPTRQFNEALAKRDYELAAEIYTEKYKKNDEAKTLAEQDFAKFLSELKQNAIDGNSTYSATAAALSVIKESNLYTGNNKTLVEETLSDLAILQEADAIYKSAVEKQNIGDHEGAIKDFNRVIELAPSYKDTTNLLARSRDRLRETVVQQVNTLQSQKNYAEAAKLIDKTLLIMPEDPVLLNMKENNATQSVSALYEEAQAEANRFFQAGDYKSMFERLDTIIKEHPEDKSIVELKKDYELKAAESFQSIADELFFNNDKEAAIEKIEEALKILPENKLLLDAKKRYELDEKDPESTTDGTYKMVDPIDEEEPDKDDQQEVKKPTYSEYAYTHSVNWNGDQSQVDRIEVKNENGANNLSGIISLKPVDKYTQVYVQIYAQNSGSLLRSGAIWAYPGEEPNGMNVNVNTYGETTLIVTLNYIYGAKIDVVLDLELK